MNEFIKLTPEQEKARKKRNIWIALALGAFMVLVFLITITQMKAGVAIGPQ